ncbi:MAG: hypothetical protein GYA17_19200 [Chloroflexi bacterium]|nr:hypothetical protein [Chloroflexota bacterium]
MKIGVYTRSISPIVIKNKLSNQLLDLKDQLISQARPIIINADGQMTGKFISSFVAVKAGDPVKVLVCVGIAGRVGRIVTEKVGSGVGVVGDAF